MVARTGKTAGGRSLLVELTYVVAIARHRNFRKAGLELGISASGLSHALKGLETRLGVRLVNRTNRSVTLTAAGQELCDAIGKPFESIDRAVEDLNRFRDAPRGRVRLNVVADAAPLLVGPVMGVFTDRYPEIEVDVVVSNRMLDVVGEGFDAGIRYGGTVPENMITQRLSADTRWVVAGAPSYLDRFGIPVVPADLAVHRCLGVRLGNDRIYDWEFKGSEGEFSVRVTSRITADDTRATLTMACAGAGLLYGPEGAVKPYIERGDLRLVLTDWATTGPGYHLYYSSRRQLPPGIRLLADLIRELRPLGL